MSLNVINAKPAAIPDRRKKTRDKVYLDGNACIFTTEYKLFLSAHVDDINMSGNAREFVQDVGND